MKKSIKKYVTILYCQYCVNVIGMPQYFRFFTYSKEYEKLLIPKSKFF